MSQDLVCAITLGQRDFQVLAASDRGLCRVSPRKTHVGALHRALRDGALKYALWLPTDASALPVEAREAEVLWQEGKVGFSRPGLHCATRNELPDRPAGPDDVVWLVPGLLARGLRELEGGCREGKIGPRRIFLFHTDRGEESERSDTEPVAAPALLTELLRRLLPALPADAIRPVCCLAVGERLTDRDAAGNTILSRRAAERIDAVLRQTARDLPTAGVWLHVSGGIPFLSEVVRASAQARFPDRVQDRSSSEDGGGRSVAAVAVTPVEELHARRRATELIHHGQFLAAEVLAQGPLKQRERDQVWGRCLHAAARYFQGYMTDTRDTLEGLHPDTSIRRHLSGLLTGGLPQALHVALRAEAALRADDILEAASLTVTFLDVALFDAVDAALRKDPGIRCVDWETRNIKRAQWRLSPRDLEQAVAAVRTKVGWLRGFDEAPVRVWCGRDFLQARELWQEHALTEAVRTLGGRADLADALDALSRALHEGARPADRPADLRNRMIHSLPSQQEIVLAAQLYSARNLWHQAPDKPRSFLHPGTLPAAVLAALGVADAERRYQQLAEALTADLRDLPLA